MKTLFLIIAILGLSACNSASGEPPDPLKEFPVRDSLWIGCWGVRWDGIVMGTAEYDEKWVGSGWNFKQKDGEYRYGKWWWRVDGTLWQEPFWLVVACFETEAAANEYGKKLYTYAAQKKRHGKTRQ